MENLPQSLAYRKFGIKDNTLLERTFSIHMPNFIIGMAI